MIIGLLIVNFVVAALMSALVVFLFKKPISNILQKVLHDDIYLAWVRYLVFAIYIVGISGGVRVWELEKYLSPGKAGPEGERVVLQLTSERWVIEVYQTIIGSLQSNIWMLLVFFIFALIAYVVVKGFESKKGATN